MQFTFANVTTNDDSSVSTQVSNEERMISSEMAGDGTLDAPFQFSDATSESPRGLPASRTTNNFAASWHVTQIRRLRRQGIV